MPRLKDDIVTLRKLLWRDARSSDSAAFKKAGLKGKNVPNELTCVQMAEMAYGGRGVLDYAVDGLIFRLIGIGTVNRSELGNSSAGQSARLALRYDPTGNNGLLPDGRYGDGTRKALETIDVVAAEFRIGTSAQASTDADPAAADDNVNGGDVGDASDANPEGTHEDGAADESLEAEPTAEVAANGDTNVAKEASDAPAPEAPNGAVNDPNAAGAVATGEVDGAGSATGTDETSREVQDATAANQESLELAGAEKS